MKPGTLSLGLGLVSIGRVWGVRQVPPPSDADAAALLERAITLGIRIFDTAPAYAASEARLGAFLRDLGREARERLVVMTKAGEHWSDALGEAFVDHGRDAMMRSIDRSLERLGRIDILQIHKATRDVVGRSEILAAIEHARACGIARIGASVSDVAAGEVCLAVGCYDVLQFPLNAGSTAMLPLLPQLRARSVVPVINRPFAMGAAIEGGGIEAGRAAFRFLDEHLRSGIVLTGTSRADHLAANVEAFHSRGGRPSERDA